MDREQFVRNIKFFCDLKGVKPTVACREAGVGTSFINNVEARGQTPSVEKVQMLAQYLGVTVSDLLGETKPPSNLPKEADLTEAEQELVAAYRAADDHARSLVDLALEPFQRERQRNEDVG